MRDSHTTDPASFKTEEAEALAADAGDLADRVTAIDGSVDVADGDASDEALVDERISALQRELTAERDKHIRLAAEFDNFRKRMMKERQEAESKGQAELVRQIIDPSTTSPASRMLTRPPPNLRRLFRALRWSRRNLASRCRQPGSSPSIPTATNSIHRFTKRSAPK